MIRTTCVLVTRKLRWRSGWIERLVHSGNRRSVSRPIMRAGCVKKGIDVAGIRGVANVLIRRVFLRSGRNYRSFASVPRFSPRRHGETRHPSRHPSACLPFLCEKETRPVVRKDSDNYFRARGCSSLGEREVRARNKPYLAVMNLIKYFRGRMCVRSAAIISLFFRARARAERRGNLLF